MLQLADIFDLYSISEFVCSASIESKIHNFSTLYHHICLKKNIKYVLHVTGAQTNLFSWRLEQQEGRNYFYEVILFSTICFIPICKESPRQEGQRKLQESGMVDS